MPLSEHQPLHIDSIYALPEGQRAELIDGVMYAMAPPSGTHQRISMFFSKVIANYIDAHKGSCSVFAAPYAVFLDDDDITYVEPDICVICDPDKMDDAGCHGAPDWIVEIVSPSTRSRDYFFKLIKYRNAGVREYWIVDPLTRTVRVYVFQDDDLTRDYNFNENIPVGIYPGFEICLGTLE